MLCPVCGNVSDGTHLALVEEVKAEGEHLPYGELVLRMGETANGNISVWIWVFLFQISAFCDHLSWY